MNRFDSSIDDPELPLDLWWRRYWLVVGERVDQRSYPRVGHDGFVLAAGLVRRRRSRLAAAQNVICDRHGLGR